MRRSTQVAPFSRFIVLAAMGALGATSFLPLAHAADTTASPSSAAAASASSAAPGPSASGSSGGDGTAKPSASAPGMGGASGEPGAEMGKPKPAKPAKAPDKKTRDAARKAYGEAEKAYAAGNYSAALSGYERANELIPSAHASYWIAKSLDQNGRTKEAIQAYEDFLAEPGSSKVGEDKFTDAQTRLAALKASLVGQITVSTVPITALVSVDGVAQSGAQPLTLKLAPGPHKLSFNAQGYDEKVVDLQVQANTKVEQHIELVPHPAPPPPPPPLPAVAPAPPAPPPPPKHSTVPGIVTLGIAGAGVVVGSIFGVKALQNKSDFDDNPSNGRADDTERNALIADMAFGVAVTLGVTGIVLLTSSDEAVDAPKTARVLLPPAKPKLRVLPYIGRESGGAAARLTF